MLSKFFAFITGMFLIGINRLDVHQPLTDTRLYLDRYSSVSQTFESHSDKLNIVNICLRNPDRMLTPLEFTVHEATDSAAPIRTIPFSAGNIDNQDCTRFQFEPIEGSNGKSYVAKVRATLPKEMDSRQGIYAEALKGEDSVKGEAYQDTKLAGADLHFKTSYRQTLSAAIRESLTQFVRRLGQDLLFFIPYTLLFGFVLYRYLKVRK